MALPQHELKALAIQLAAAMPPPQALESEHLLELGARLEDACTVLHLATDLEPGDGAEAKQLHAAAITALRLVCSAIEALDRVEARASH